MGVKHRAMVIYLQAVKGYLLRVDLNGIFFLYRISKIELCIQIYFRSWLHSKTYSKTRLKIMNSKYKQTRYKKYVLFVLLFKSLYSLRF